MAFTPRIKTGGVFVSIVIAGLLVANQYHLQGEVDQVKASVYKPLVEKVIITATPEPTATPAGMLKTTLKPVITHVVVSPVVTKAVVK